jgi:hypothetical protein
MSSQMPVPAPSEANGWHEQFEAPDRDFRRLKEDLRGCNEVNGAGNHQPRNFISIFRTLKKFTFLP